MKKSGWNPTRRNRNLGTEKAGLGNDNRMRIPEQWNDCRRYWEKLNEYQSTSRIVHGRSLRFVVEPTRADCVHACTVDDIATVMQMVPSEHAEDIQGIVLRQPTRKEQQLSPVWGRLGFSTTIGPITGAAILLEATLIPLTVTFGRKLSVESQQELERLRLEAANVEDNGREHILTFDMAAIRTVQLFRTLLHEIGHWVDYRQNVTIPSASDPDLWLPLWERYWQRPSAERESYAHRYSVEAATKFRDRGMIPFERMLNVDQLHQDGLHLNDFAFTVA